MLQHSVDVTRTQPTIQDIDDLLCRVIPDQLQLVGYDDAADMMRKIPSMQGQPARLRRMPKVLNDMLTKVTSARSRVVAFEMRSEPELRGRFTLYRQELEALSGTLMRTAHLIRSYTADLTRVLEAPEPN